MGGIQPDGPSTLGKISLALATLTITPNVKPSVFAAKWCFGPGLFCPDLPP